MKKYKKVLFLFLISFILFGCTNNKNSYNDFSVQEKSYFNLKIEDIFVLNNYNKLDLIVSYADKNVTQYRYNYVSGLVLNYHKVTVDNKTNKVVSIRNYKSN